MKDVRRLYKIQFRLSPAYDLLPVNIIIPEDKEQFALTMNGKKRNLHRNDFLHFADTCGITKTAAAKMINKITSMQSEYEKSCGISDLSEIQKKNLVQLMRERVENLKDIS